MASTYTGNWYHYLMRDEKGWTFVGGSYSDPKKRDSAIKQNKMAYPSRKFVPYDTNTYQEAVDKCRKLNIQNKGVEAFKEKFPSTPLPK